MARKENDSLRNYLTRKVCTQETSVDIGTLPNYINELMGHSQGNIDLDRYGKGYNPDILFNKCVKKIVYETSHTRKIDFHSLKLDWKKILI